MGTTATKSVKKNGEARKDSKGKIRKVTTTPNENESELQVFFKGPFSNESSNPDDRDERPFWIICVSSNLEAQPKYAYRVWNYEKAVSLADKIAKDQGVTIISTAIPAS